MAQAGGQRDPGTDEKLQAGEGLDGEAVATEDLQAADEAPPVRHHEAKSTAPPTKAKPPHFPQGPQPGFRRPEGTPPPAIRTAERIIDRNPRAKGRARRAARAE